MIFHLGHTPLCNLSLTNDLFRNHRRTYLQVFHFLNKMPNHVEVDIEQDDNVALCPKMSKKSTLPE